MPNFKPAALEPFSNMTPTDREFILLELRKRLQYMAIVSRAVNDPNWRKMKRLGERIERDHETLAANTEKSATVTYQALNLLTEVHHELSGTRH